MHPSIDCTATGRASFEPGALARRLGLARAEPLLVALSGGADSVLLLHALAADPARRPLFALHVDHGLRGAESRADADFCEELCSELCVPFRSVEVAIDAQAGDIEARARRERYRALCSEADRLGLSTVATGHHADDALETLLLRWTRGSSLSGVSGPSARLALTPRTRINPTDRRVVVVRPLLHLRRSDIRRELEERGLAWREDSSNADMRFTRNRIRHAFLPAIAAHCGDDAVDHLLAFGRAVATLEDALAGRIAHLAWTPAAGAISVASASVGAPFERRLARAELDALPRSLQGRALVRLLAEATGRKPGAKLLADLLEDFAARRSTRRALPGGWTLLLRPAELLLLAPSDALRPALRAGEPRCETLRLALPGEVRLADGRSITAELLEPAPDAPVSHDPYAVDLDATGLPGDITVRFARPGDRFHALGAPGSKRLCRFLADAGIPREERARVPLVVAGTELVWVAGVRPCDRRRVRASTRKRLRLELEVLGRRELRGSNRVPARGL